jgi:hypothetical protein
MATISFLFTVKEIFFRAETVAGPIIKSTERFFISRRDDIY